MATFQKTAETLPRPERSFLARISISPAEPRLRAGWRLLLQTILMMGALLLITSSPFWKQLQLTKSNFTLLVRGVIELALVVFSVYIARRFLDKRSFHSLGLAVNARMLADVLTGILVALVIAGSIYLAEIALGWSTFESFAWDVEPAGVVTSGVLTFLAAYILGSCKEELLFRGYHLQTLASGLNLFWGLLVSSTLFGLLHLSDPNATWISAAGVFFGALFLGYAYIRTRQLWLPIGLHFGWNFFQGVLFGFPVSGWAPFRILRHHATGPELWTGGPFGPEAGLIVLPAFAVGMALVYAYTRYTRKRPPKNAR